MGSDEREEAAEVQEGSTLLVSRVSAHSGPLIPQPGLPWLISHVFYV